MTQVIANIAIIVLCLHFSYQFAIHTDVCPTNKQSWLERSNEIICENLEERYHCIQGYRNGLIETCMQPHKIKRETGGCPFIKIRDGRPYLGNPFFTCDETDSGCPGNSHGIYQTNELYKYPACLVPFYKPSHPRTHHLTIERSSSTIRTQEAHSGYSTANQTPVTVVVTVVILIGCQALCFAVYRLYRYLKDMKLKVSHGFRVEVLEKMSLTKMES